MEEGVSEESRTCQSDNPSSLQATPPPMVGAGPIEDEDF